MKLLLFIIAISHILHASEEKSENYFKSTGIQKAQHLLHMMWIADQPENYVKISEVVSKAYEWSQADSNVHVIVWHNNPKRKMDLLFPREQITFPMVTLRHISSLYSPDVLGFIKSLPCNISRAGESLSEGLSLVLPALLGNGTQMNVYPQCDLVKILTMFWQATYHPEKKLMCADLSIRVHKISDLCLSYQSSLDQFGIVMANMAFPKDAIARAEMIASHPFGACGQDSTIVASTSPGFENSAFLVNCRHATMLSVMGATLLRPLSSRIIKIEDLNKDLEFLFLQMTVSFFYLNLMIRGDERLFIKDLLSVLTAIGTDFVARTSPLLSANKRAYIPMKSVHISLEGTFLERYIQQDLLMALIVETVMCGGFVQNMYTGEIKKFPLAFIGQDGHFIKKAMFDSINAQWYNIEDLAHLAVPIMDQHDLLTKASHFLEIREAQFY